jgi:benzil reductase ((S)-benzoin forming)
MRLAIVTGTSSRIGAALARRLLAGGWEVIGVARRAVDFGPPRYRHLSLDLEDTVALVTEFERAVAPLVRDPRWRRVALVNNAAGPGRLARLERLDPGELLRLYAVNCAAPIWLMGFALRFCRPEAALRIVNVSSGAAVRAFPGLSAYASSKAALRMAGMVLGAELDSSGGGAAVPPDTAILSYEPGTVDTPMQANARSRTSEDFPSADLFRGFAERGSLVSPDAPACEIVSFLEADGHARFTERRLGV